MCHLGNTLEIDNSGSSDTSTCGQLQRRAQVSVCAALQIWQEAYCGDYLHLAPRLRVMSLSLPNRISLPHW